VADTQSTGTELLLLGPFCGKPACQLIRVAPLSKARGVCADAFNKRETLLVADVNSYPGHIACDGETNSEIVSPIVLKGREGQGDTPIGVFDLDCLALNGFGEEDKHGIERIVELLVRSCDW
jgi:L-methionine (R)-S-oxide reductase